MDEVTPERLLEAARAAGRIAAHGDWDSVEDLAGHVVVQYYSKPPAHENIEAWAIRVAKNAAVDGHRKQARVDIEEPTDSFFDRLLPLAWSPSARAIPAQVIARVLAVLDPDERRAISLRAGEDMSAAEIAAEMGITAHQVDVLISAARRKMKLFADQTSD